MAGGILYVSYDGMLEPLGQSQVLAYLERLAADRPIDLISFEKKGDWADKVARNAIRERCRAAGIRWHPLRYHKRPSAAATAWDITAGSARATAIAFRRRPAIIHARSYVAGLMALAAKRASGAKFLFDMRGFWADERVDGGLWPRDGRLYRAAKSVEDRLLRAADHVITLTHASAEELLNFPAIRERKPSITVIPTCADLDRFTPAEAKKEGPFTLGYVGSIDHWYRLDDMLRCYGELLRRQPDARLLMVTRGDHDRIRKRARSLGVPIDPIETVAAKLGDVPDLIRRMDVAMALYDSNYSRLACAPTKLGEYLGCGVPCLGSAGVGDMQAILDSCGVGITLHASDDSAIAAAITELVDLAADPDIAARCRQAAVALFSLDQGVRDYRSVYESLSPRT
jgi:glycosyltransferase involved in cell wall biosynthesis